MGLSIVFALLAAAASDGARVAAVHVPTKAVAPAQASVRILSGARVSLANPSSVDGYKFSPSTYTAEDGSKRTAQLVEFQ